MRPIKFRGFRNFKGNALYPPDKRWIYGYYYFNAGEHWIKNKADMTQTFIVEEGSVGEYTGRKDKKGKEIWEGDIIAIDGGAEPVKTSVFFQDGCFCVDMLGNPCEIKYYINMTFCEIEIIGTLYEHPELLEHSPISGC